MGGEGGFLVQEHGAVTHRTQMLEGRRRSPEGSSRAPLDSYILDLKAEGVSHTLQVMKKVIQQYAKDLTAGRLASGYEHSYRVHHLARKIGEELDYDDEILHDACFLHDIEMTRGHTQSSAEKAKAILQETGFEPGKIAAVYSAVLNHMPGTGGKADSIEGKLLHDANLLDTLGAVGFARLSIGSFFWYHFKTMSDVVKLLQQWLGYAGSFYFEKSKNLAGEKIEFMRHVLKQFSRELNT